MKATVRTPTLPEPGVGLPANIEAERVILGSILLENARYAEVAAVLAETDFCLTAHQELFRIMGRMVAAGTAVDEVTLLEQLMHTRALQRIGGAVYIASLNEGLPRRIALPDYLRIVKEKARLRELLAVFEQGWTRALASDAPALDIGREAVRQLKGIFQERKPANHPETLP